MKKSILFLLLFSLSLIACSTTDDSTIDNTQPNPAPEASTVISSFAATIDNSSRASGVIDQNKNIFAYWSENDKIVITDRARYATFTIESGQGSNKGTFVGSLDAADVTLYAIYPSSATTVLTNNKLKVNVATKQSHYSGSGKDLKDKIILFGKSDNRKQSSLSPIIAAIRFDIKVLDNQSIKSITTTCEGCNIAGECYVDYQSGALTATGSNSVTLNYAVQPKGSSTDGWVTIAPTNFDKNSMRVLYDIETSDGDYTFCYTPDTNIAAGQVYTVSLSTETFVRVADRENLRQGEYYCSLPMPEPDPEPGSVAKGRITYNDGTPAVGVSVSDGFSVVQTDKQGNYSLTPHVDAWYIFYTTPADCAISTNSSGHPTFYTKYERERFVYNFTLSKLKNGVDPKFSLFCLADPQCSSLANRNRFVKESAVEINKHAASKGHPCYGVTLGDIVSSSASSDTTPHMPYMREHMSSRVFDLPIFQTMGNHDFTYFNSSAPINPDETSSTYNIKAQRLFEDTFGPINYSWERSDAHIISMRNMQWKNNTEPGNYTMSFSDEQYEWLKQDLSFVPKSKLVILCVHIPIVNSSNKNVQNVINLLSSYQEAHIMAGHTHYTRNEPTLSKGVFEHVHAAVCGAWWHANTNGDGVPNGYGVYDIEGSTITNWYFMGVNANMNDRDYQIRLYRGNHKSGGKYEYFAQQHGDGVLLANIFNADDSWSIKVYEDGVYSGTMSKIAYKKETPAQGTGIDNPTKPSTKSSQDWWAIGYLRGVKGRSRESYFTSCFHLYKYTLKNKSAKIRVEATDRFGRTYSCDKITEDYDYSLMNAN